ncbi:MAG: Hsp20/alpha crystallin family protein [Planctomycetes bacterium]|nr:Hsp20/alpha crystallin family protein [Planctomycetota bacterium]
MAKDDKELQKADPQQPIEAERVDRAPVFAPAADILETEQGAVMLVDLPGCDEGAVDIRVEEGVLTVRGRVAPGQFPGHELTYGEYRVGDYERAFSVSELIDTGKIEATVKDGVLRLTLPKVEAAKPKKIQVKVS